MIALFEAGGTKTELWLGDGSRKITIPGPGINPYIQEDGEIFLRLEIFFHNKEVEPLLISHVFYFGAGCAHPLQINRIEKLLHRFFPHSKIVVQSDLLGAAFALCGNDPGLVGILGTGSNACLFDGKIIIKQMVSLGFWLGDEGSGGYIGKMIFSDWLKNRLPKELELAVSEIFPAEKKQALEFIYTDKNPNKTLASLARLAFQFRETDYAKLVLSKSLDAYFEEITDLWNGKKSLDFYFTGSIAKELQKEIKHKVENFGFTLKKVIGNPSESLFQYHLNFL